MGEFIITERPSERVAHIVLNRPERRNALVGPLADQFLVALDDVHNDDAVTVIVIRGAGNAFCSGLDLKEFNADPRPDWVPQFGEKWQAVHRRLFESDRILVGALERAAVNGGAALAFACDFLVAGDESFIQVGEIQQGMAAPMNMAWLRLRYDEATAARIALLGDRIYGPDMVSLGIAYASVPDADVLQHVDQLVDRLAQHEPGGVRRIKTSLRRTAVTETAEQWFARALVADPMQGTNLRPVAATE